MPEIPENVRISNPSKIFKPTGYSQVAEITAGRLIILAGQVGFDREGNLVGPGDMEAQARQAFENIKLALEACGASYANVVKFTFFTTDITQLGIVRKIRDEYINTDNPPTSTAVEVRRLVRDDIVLEVEAVAALPA